MAQVYADPAVVDYAVRLVAATRAPGMVGLVNVRRVLEQTSRAVARPISFAS